MAKQHIISCSLNDKEIEWIDDRRNTEYGELTRSAVIRKLIRDAMKRPDQ